jgi:hypothetical protein
MVSCQCGRELRRSGEPEDSCERIGLPSGGATITSAQVATLPADPLNPGATRDYCKVLGEVQPIDPNAPPVNFEVNLPAGWNGNMAVAARTAC